MRERKGVELAMNTIVMAAIAIIILVTVLFFYGRQAQIFGGSTAKYCPCEEVKEFSGECPGDLVKVYRPVEGNDCQDDEGNRIRRGNCCVSVEEVAAAGGGS